MGDLKCPKCGNNSFQVRSHADDQRAVTFICVGCWDELRLNGSAVPQAEERARSLVPASGCPEDHLSSGSWR